MTEAVVWQEIPRENVLREGGIPLYCRAVCQPWTGAEPRMRVDIGLFASRNIGKIPDFSHRRFPSVHIATFYANFMPGSKDIKCGLPSLPYLIDPREDFDEEDTWLPSSCALKTVYWRLMTNVTAPHNKSDMDAVDKVLSGEKGDWRKDKIAMYSFPPPKEEDTETVNTATAGESSCRSDD